MRLVAFDFETTGVDTEADRVIEFCFIELGGDLEELGRWTELVHPGIPIPPEAVRIHNITNEMVAGRPAFAHYAARIQALVQGAVLVAHNHAFDLSVLHRELRRAGERGLDPNHPCIDTLEIERQFHNNKLESVYRRYTGKDMGQAHRSEADTAACVEVLRQQRVAHRADLPPTLEGLLVPNLQAHFGGGQARRWVDHDKKYVWIDEAGTFRFGRWSKKHADKALTQVAKEDGSYLSWMVEKGTFPAEVKAAVQAVLRGGGA